MNHQDWLELVPRDGLLLSEPVLNSAYPDGFRRLSSYEHQSFRRKAERYQLGKQKQDPARYREWIHYVLHDLLPYTTEAYFTTSIPAWARYHNYEFEQEVTPDLVLRHPDKADQGALLIVRATMGQALDRKSTEAGKWRVSPTGKLEHLLRNTGHPLGLVTNGDAFRLVYAPAGLPSGKVTFTTTTLTEDRSVLAAFRGLLGPESLLRKDNRSLLALAEQSQDRQKDVADELGSQVRHAVDALLASIDRLDRQHDGALLDGLPPDQIYELHLVIAMRLLFQLFAEERGMLPHGELLYDQAYGVNHLWQTLQEQHRTREASLDTSYDAWRTLLASWRLIHKGASHPNLNMRPYGGTLFDPDRYPILEDERLLIPNRTIWTVLYSLLYAGMQDGAKQRVSYQELGVEQIGYMYEGLLDHAIKRADHPILILKKDDAEVDLDELDAQPEDQRAAYIARTKAYTGTDAKKRLDSVLPLDPIPDEWAHLPAKLTERAKPYQSIAASVVEPGRLYLGRGTARRATGTHYTPVTLTERVIRVTLKPLCYSGEAENKRIRTPKELLDLKVCDPAMGSGAFLVQAVRYLSERLTESWAAQAALHDEGTPLAAPYAMPSTDAERDRIIPPDDAEARLLASRYVASQSIYGVDKNPLAVEMGKLSLWLATLSRDKPFTFVDHALKAGDSLVGVTEDQLKDFSLNPAGKTKLFASDLPDALSKAVEERAEIERIPVFSPEDEANKHERLKKAEAAISFFKLAGDSLIGAFFQGTTDKHREEHERVLATMLSEARTAFMGDETVDEGKLQTLEERTRTALAEQTPFHWFLEYPEVFGQGGFNAIVGNPPFLGGTLISGFTSDAYLAYLKFATPESDKTTNLVAYFLRGAFRHLRLEGRVGILATNSIADGDTRAAGLAPILDQEGGTIFNAVKSIPWPGEANTHIALVHIVKGPSRECVLDGSTVEGISSYLTPWTGEDLVPRELLENRELSYQGSVSMGTGFLLSEESDALKTLEQEALKRYLIGDDINGRADSAPSRWTIFFADWPLERVSESSWNNASSEAKKDMLRRGLAEPTHRGPVAADYPAALAKIRRDVLPERLHLKNNADGLKYKTYWWRYGRSTPGLYKAVASLDRVLVRSRVSDLNIWTWQPTDYIFSDATVVYATEEEVQFAYVQSTIHDLWIRQYGSAMRTDMRYSPRDCFGTFPRPNSGAAPPGTGLSASEYYNLRASLAAQLSIGLTELYNRFHRPTDGQPMLSQLRRLHAQVDANVCHAYGWSDVALDHGFYVGDERYSEALLEGLSPKERKKRLSDVRFTVSPEARKELLKRLLKLNHERHEEEFKNGLVEVTDKGKVKPTTKGKQWLQKRREAERKARGVGDSQHRGSGGGGRQEAVLAPATPLFGGGTEEP